MVGRGASEHSMRDLSPDQGSNPWPLRWKCRVITTGLPGNALKKKKADNTSDLLIFHTVLFGVNKVILFI